MQKTFVSNWQC